jgi:hypothetical protein
LILIILIVIFCFGSFSIIGLLFNFILQYLIDWELRFVVFPDRMLQI